MLKQKIQEDLKQAMIARDEAKLSAIRMLKSALQYYEIQKGGAGYEASDEDVIEVIGKEIKKRRESIEMYKSGGRDDAALNEQKEIEILQAYMPEQLSEEEIKKLVDQAISESGASTMADMGRVMGLLMPRVKGKADSSLISNLVKERLSA